LCFPHKVDINIYKTSEPYRENIQKLLNRNFYKTKYRDFCCIDSPRPIFSQHFVRGRKTAFVVASQTAPPSHIVLDSGCSSDV
jgi:hypothetical protein